MKRKTYLKTVSLLMAACMLLSLFACGVQGSNESGTSSTRQQGIQTEDIETFYQLPSVAPGKAEDYYVKLLYFPNWGRHNNPGNTDNFDPYYETEWGVVSRCLPRFEGHHQPNIPVWGYTNASDPKVMAKKIDAVTEFGVDCFQFDWYWYKERRLESNGIRKDGKDGIYFGEELEYGFLQSENNTKMDFSLLWCNETTTGNFIDSFDAEEWDVMTDYIIENYFSRPNYSRYPDKNGGLVFSIYQPQVFVNSFKNEYNAVDLRLAKKAIADFRQKVADAGLGKLCVTVPDGRMGALMDDVLSNRLYAGGTIEDDDGTQYTLGTWTAEASAKYIGLDFIENIWIGTMSGVKETVVAETGSKTDMADIVHTNFYIKDENGMNFYERRFDTWKNAGFTFVPGWSPGQDVSPRIGNSNIWDVRLGYPHGTVIVNNTPELLQEAFINIRKTMDKYGQTWCCLGSFNEWGEGHFYEPDTLYGYGRLRAIQSVFG